MKPGESRILDKSTLAAFLADRKVDARANYALSRGGNVTLHITEDNEIAAEVADAATLDARDMEEIGRMIAREQMERGAKPTLNALEK